MEIQYRISIYLLNGCVWDSWHWAEQTSTGALLKATCVTWHRYFTGWGYNTPNCTGWGTSTFGFGGISRTTCGLNFHQIAYTQYLFTPPTNNGTAYTAVTLIITWSLNSSILDYYFCADPMSTARGAITCVLTPSVSPRFNFMLDKTHLIPKTVHIHVPHL